MDCHIDLHIHTSYFQEFQSQGVDERAADLVYIETGFLEKHVGAALGLGKMCKY